MADHDIRVLDNSQLRTAHTLFRGALHHPPAPDEMWKRVETGYEPGRTLGAFAGEEMIGTVHSWASSLVVPGGTAVPMAAVSRVGVRTDWTRRGVLSALFRAQAQALCEAGDIAATLRATEGVIYGRFGYGVATRGRTVRIDRRRAALHATAPSGGEVRLVDADTAEQVMPVLFARHGLVRPGAIGRWQGWWDLSLRRHLAPEENVKIAVHSGADGDDGYVVYKVERGEHTIAGDRRSLHVYDMAAAGAEAWAGLWRFLLRVDLVDEVVAELRPVDEPVEWLLGDARALSVSALGDETWLRLVDVPAALAARAYGAAEPVVIEVNDRFLPDNSGTYRITSDGAERGGRPAHLRLDADALASAYLGDVSFTQLAAAGRVQIVDPAALPHADRLFATDRAPWCGTYF